MYASQINRRKALTCVDFLVFSGERCCMLVRSTVSLICVDFFGVQWRKMMYASQINRRKALICVDFFGVQWRKMLYASQINRHKALIFWCSVEKDVVCQSDQQMQSIDLC